MSGSLSSWEAALPILESIEKRLFAAEPAAASPAPATAEFRAYGNWFIRTASHAGSAGALARRIPGLRSGVSLRASAFEAAVRTRNPAPVLGPVLGRPFAPRVQGAVRPDACLLHGNIVAVYDRPAEACVLKSSMAPRKREKLRLEVEKMQWLSAHLARRTSEVQFPTVLQYENESEYPFFTQTLIHGQTLSEAFASARPRPGSTARLTAIWRRIGEFLWEVYGVYGFAGRPVSEVYQRLFHEPFSPEALERTGLSRSLRTGVGALFEAARPIVERDRTLPCSLIYGDLGVEDVVLDPQDQIWLIDWGTSRSRPIIEDQDALLQMAAERSPVAELVAEGFERVRNPGAYSLPEQRLLRNLYRLHGLVGSLAEDKPAKAFSKRASSPRSVRLRVQRLVRVCERLLKDL